MVIITKIKSLFNPYMFQGWGVRRKYFEGWYFKVVNSSSTKALAFIPGISMDEEGRSHAFIQVLDGKEKVSEFHAFDVSLFMPSAKDFRLSVGKNHFSANGMSLDLSGFKGELVFSDNFPWPGRWYSPGIMGPYTFAPFMECNHGVISMDHSISGTLWLNGEAVDFTGGRGYIEKDWGHSFPSAYIWMQSNHFSTPGISFKASVARIPWVTGNFTGFIAGFRYGDTLHRYTEYNGSKIVGLDTSGSIIRMELRNRATIISITAPFDHATPLASPVSGRMGGRIEESMTSVINISLTDRSTGMVLFRGEGRNASIEKSGDTGLLKPKG